MRTIACIYPLFQQAEDSGLKELAWVSHAYANVINHHQNASISANNVTGRKRTFNKRNMFSNAITPCPDHTIHRAILVGAGVPTKIFTSASDKNSKTQDDDEFAGFK